MQVHDVMPVLVTVSDWPFRRMVCLPVSVMHIVLGDVLLTVASRGMVPSLDEALSASETHIG